MPIARCQHCGRPLLPRLGARRALQHRLPWEGEAMTAPLASQFADRRRALDGPGRLLRELVKRGLPEEYLRAAALLVAVLDEEAGR